MTSNNAITTATQENAELSLVEIRLDKLRFPRLVRIPRETAALQLHGIITEALTFRGQEASEETVAFMASSLYDLLIQDEEGIGLKYITLEEIRREIRAAALGCRREIYGVHVSSIYGVLRDYALGAGHQAEEAARRRAKYAEEQAKKGSAVEAFLDAAAGKIVNANKKRIYETK